MIGAAQARVIDNESTTPRRKKPVPRPQKYVSNGPKPRTKQPKIPRGSKVSNKEYLAQAVFTIPYIDTQIIPTTIMLFLLFVLLNYSD